MNASPIVGYSRTCGRASTSSHNTKITRATCTRAPWMTCNSCKVASCNLHSSQSRRARLGGGHSRRTCVRSASRASVAAAMAADCCCRSTQRSSAAAASDRVPWAAAAKPSASAVAACAGTHSCARKFLEEGGGKGALHCKLCRAN